MKKFIYKTNQYLLERYPTIWNTKLVWMLSIALVLHLIFFVFGLFTLVNPKMLQDSNVEYIFFENGSIFLSIVISILLVVAWLINMFKNNGVKNFYPSSRLKLFGQFFQYLIIIFSCTTFYLSYQYGMKTYISATYSNEQITNEIKIANDAALFLSENITDYTLNQRRFPKPFYELYCEDNSKFIDYDKPYLSFEDEDYQYYSLRTVETKIGEPYNTQIIPQQQSYDGSTNTGYVFSKTTDSLRIYFFKDSVINMNAYIKTPYPTYYNMSSTFYKSKNDKIIEEPYDYNYNDYEEYDYSYNRSFSTRHQFRNQRNYELLERNDRNEIKTLLADFLKISDNYKINHNLTTNEWLDLVYHPTNFEVRNFIRDTPKAKHDYNSRVNVDRTKTEEFFYNRLTDYHYQNRALSNVFENIESIKASDPAEGIHIFIWIAFFFAALIFIFRISGLKELLFSIIIVGVLTLVISLFTALIFYLAGGSDDVVMYFIIYFIFTLATIILLIPILFYKSIKKLIVSICVNISIVGFSLYLLLILGIITMHQSDACRADPNYYDTYRSCDTVFDIFEFGWSWILFFSGIIFIFFFTKVIKNWKALPEG
ncbi:hypothetical protein [Psychroserpens sp. Hel_I_66]|uniref:hypothetical protein n=1 Tax=Psychroserpens sp. Hel_I_66 TaxID=1250004 RepID=UPI00068BD124|nr:hypothetical protein [Psychroserpens sp. Hel_I_66]